MSSWNTIGTCSLAVGSVILADFLTYDGKKDGKTSVRGFWSSGEKAISGTNEVVGVERIELSTSCSQSRRPTAGLHPVYFEFTTLDCLIGSSMRVSELTEFIDLAVA